MPKAYLQCKVKMGTSTKDNFWAPTTACLRELSQPQKSVVTGHRFEGDVAVPTFLRALLLVEVQESILVDLFGLLGADDTDLVILPSKTATRVADGMNV